MTRHNIKPSAIPAILSVLLDPDIMQCRGSLSKSSKCFCALGCMMEGYRRTMRPDLEQGQITHFGSAREFWDWLLVDGEADRGLPMIDGKVVTELNDYKGWTLKQFAEALQEVQ